MKRLVLFIVFTVIAYSSFSQKIRFTDTTNHWITGRTYYQGTWFISDQFSGSITRSGFDYLILNNCLVREDSIEGRVYFRDYQPSQPPIDTAEYVVYDYNWKVGDTVTRYMRLSSAKVPVFYTVDKIDSLLIQNTYHKVWEFSWLQGSPAVPLGHAPVIEGIGCVAGPDWPFNLPSFMEGGLALYCFMTNNTKPYISYLPFDNTHSCLESVNDDIVEGANPLVFPNPVTHSSCVKVTRISKGYLVIWNALGQEVYRQEFANVSSIPIGEHLKLPGMYFYRLLDHSRKSKGIYKGRFLTE